MDEHAFELNDLVRTAKDRQVNLRWPIPVDARLDALLDRATAAGERTNRRELVAALVATTDLGGDELGDLLRRFRKMRVRDAVLEPPSDGRVVHISDKKPGPRTARGS